MKRLSKYAYAKTNILVCAFLTLVMILYASLVLGSQGECVTEELAEGYSLLGLKTGYSHEYAETVLGMLSSEALLCYSRLLRIWDNLFPFLYGSMYIAWLSLIFKNARLRNENLYLVNLYPLVPLVADLIENYFENSLISEFLLNHSISEISVQVASGFTLIKWGFSMINYLLIISGVVLIFVRFIKKQKRKQSQRT